MISRFDDLDRLTRVLHNPNDEESDSLEILFHALSQRIDERADAQDNVR